MKTKARSISRENRGAPAPSSFQRSESPDAARRTITAVMRRQGYLLLSVLSVAMDELIRLKAEGDAEELNDAVKPLADGLIHFGFERTESDNEIP